MPATLSVNPSKTDHTPSPAPSPGKGLLVQRLFANIAQRYDLANHLLSGGLDFLWRRRAATLVKSWQPTMILDLATGSGDLALAIRRACPAAQVTGADFCLPMLQQAQRKGLTQVIQADAMALPFQDAAFDALTVAFGLRNMEDWQRALAEMARVIRPEGHVLILDFSIPPQPFRAPYRLYLHHILPRLAGVLTGERDAYAYLGASIETFPQGEGMCALLEGAGFSQTVAKPLTGGIVTLYHAIRCSA